MPRQKILQGLRRSAQHEAASDVPIVLDKRTGPIYRPTRLPSFFLGGGLAQPGHDPELMYDGPRIKLRQNGHTSWVPVSADAYSRAVIQRVYTG